MMAQTSEINSASVEAESASEKQEVKVKLHITLTFAIESSGSQTKISSFFRRGKQCNLEHEYFNQAVREGDFTYFDRDEGEYLIKEKIFVIDEKSLQGMRRAAEDVDSYIYSFCIDCNVNELVVCILIPTFSNESIIPKFFLNSFTLKSFVKSQPKLNLKKSSILYYNFEKVILRSDAGKEQQKQYCNVPLGQLQIQLAALMSYYVYFYIDMYEQQNWSFLKKDIADTIRINKFISNKQDIKGSFWKAVWESLTNIPSVTWEKLTKAFDFFCNYDGHVRNRIYGRIFDVLKIVYPDAEESYYVTKIMELLEDFKDHRETFGIYDFFRRCGYWEYLGNKKLEVYCKQWHIYKDSKNDNKEVLEAGKISGYGAALFTDGRDYIYTFKGTDFDSYGKDWLTTNVLQGLTGFSLQHAIASSKAKYYDKLVGDQGNLWFTGHSLGGGLASAATISTSSRYGITFNAAGLNVFGVKLNQLINHPSRILKPWKDWERVTPYRIKGEVLDTGQKIGRMAVPVLERGYGGQSVDIEIMNKTIPCAARHGINNFLYREVMASLNTFSKSAGSLSSTMDNKIVRVEFHSKDINMEGSLI